jgi:hypothetical protein
MAATEAGLRRITGKAVVAAHLPSAAMDQVQQAGMVALVLRRLFPVRL